ncbi:hypothetical protein [Roseovarius pacificus]|uniref:hypothetical protein n=1 Tax=Roseovarius pacificus TaxID=337701 RepID=UPI002A18BCE4|nr:hypothetical protein [Roseovarius pacificus]
MVKTLTMHMKSQVMRDRAGPVSAPEMPVLQVGNAFGRSKLSAKNGAMFILRSRFEQNSKKT